MPETTYTPEQMSDAGRLLDAIKRVPEEKQPEALRAAEAVLVGVAIGATITEKEGERSG